jgi:YfiH family protein
MPGTGKPISVTGPIPIKDATLEGNGATTHGFFTREGGVSTGIYRGLNTGIGSDDDRDSVIENRRRVASALGVEADALATPYQIHSDKVAIVSVIPEDRPQVDAFVTAQSGIALGILTADCGPVIFSDHEAGVIGVAHAGWKGATGGVLENAVLAMESLGAKRHSIRAVLGPTIGPANYEIGPDLIALLQGLNPNNAKFLSRSERDSHAMFDLPAYILARLSAFGVDAKWTGHCTYADEERFYSYRRKTHRHEPDYGRQISAICLNG